MSNGTRNNFQSSLYKNNTTRIITTTIGILLALAGFEHGLFEVFQGNRPTDGFFIQAIGESIKWWKHGTEDAFTIIPTTSNCCLLVISN